MNEERNYLREYYKKGEIDLQTLVKDINEDTIKTIKKEIARLQSLIDTQSLKLHKELDKTYGKNFTQFDHDIILKYQGRNETIYFNLESGLRVDTPNDTDTIYTLYNKNGEKEITVGYNLEYASLIVKLYKYSINKDNTQITLKPLTLSVVSFMNTNGTRTNLSTNITTNINVEGYSGYEGVEKGKDFIKALYGVDYEGKYSLKSLRRYNLINKSFEIIMKTAPNEIKDRLLEDVKAQESMPIHKMLCISQDTYNRAIQKGCIGYLYDSLKYIVGDKKDKLNKTESEWLDIIDEMKAYEEDLQFYGISYGYSWGRTQTLLETLLEGYCSNPQIQNYYSFNKYTNYVVNETINQGYTSVTNFIGELRDYLRMCDLDNITPTLYSSYLKQTHDITSRNHKIRIEREGEEIFKSRYENFKEFKYGDYYVIAPTETKDLQREGDNLNHCVASYIKRVIDGTCLIYFLRTDKEASLVTFEVRDNTIVQVKGKHNRKPSENEIKALVEFASARGLETRF